MTKIKKELTKQLENKNLSFYQLSKEIGCYESSLNKMINGKRIFTGEIKKQLASFLSIDEAILESWIIIDKYPKELLQQAFEVRKEFHPNKRKAVLLTKIDEALENKDLSRTALSKHINYSQSMVNAMITGKKPMSKTVISRIALALELEESQINSWIIADKYSLKVLEYALISINDSDELD